MDNLLEIMQINISQKKLCKVGSLSELKAMIQVLIIVNIW